MTKLIQGADGITLFRRKLHGRIAEIWMEYPDGHIQISYWYGFWKFPDLESARIGAGVKRPARWLQA